MYIILIFKFKFFLSFTRNTQILLLLRREGELAIDNSEGQQSTILREDLPGFIFESNKGATHSFNAELTLG